MISLLNAPSEKYYRLAGNLFDENWSESWKDVHVIESIKNDLLYYKRVGTFTSKGGKGNFIPDQKIQWRACMPLYELDTYFSEIDLNRCMKIENTLKNLNT